MCLYLKYLDLDTSARRTISMTGGLFTLGPLTSAQADLSDSLDVRLMLAGRLSLDAMQLRRDREELAAVLGRAEAQPLDPPSDQGDASTKAE
jgi:hypothetical protein